MSRVGKKIINIPTDVTVTFDGHTATVKGPKGNYQELLMKKCLLNKKKTLLK